MSVSSPTTRYNVKQQDRERVWAHRQTGGMERGGINWSGAPDGRVERDVTSLPYVRKRLIPSIDPYYPLYQADGFLILCRHLYEKGMLNPASFYSPSALYLSENMGTLKENFDTS